MGRFKRIWYLSPMRAAKVQVSLRIRAVSPEPPLLTHTSSESRGTFRQKARSLAPLNGRACAVKICHDGMLEDTNSLDGVQMSTYVQPSSRIQNDSRVPFFTIKLWKNSHTQKLQQLSRSLNSSVVQPKKCWHGPDHVKTCLMSYANNKGADQPAHPRSLISTFVVHCLDSMICILAIYKVWGF